MSSSSRETESAIELELSADELRRLSRHLTPEPTGMPVRSICLRGRGLALTLSLGLAALLFGIAVQRMGIRTKPARTAPPALTADASATPLPPEPARNGSPVRFANPFDPSEVFEFPPGTSRESARETVAEILISRARDRHIRRVR